MIVYLQKYYIVYVCKRDIREIYRFHSILNILWSIVPRDFKLIYHKIDPQLIQS